MDVFSAIDAVYAVGGVLIVVGALVGVVGWLAIFVREWLGHFRRPGGAR